MMINRAVSARVLPLRARKLKVHPAATQAVSALEEIEFLRATPFFSETNIIPAIVENREYFAVGYFLTLIQQTKLDQRVICCCLPRDMVSDDDIHRSAIFEIASIPQYQLARPRGHISWRNEINRTVPADLAQSLWGRQTLSKSKCAELFQIDRGIFQSARSEV